MHPSKRQRPSAPRAAAVSPPAREPPGSTAALLLERYVHATGAAERTRSLFDMLVAREVLAREIGESPGLDSALLAGVAEADRRARRVIESNPAPAEVVDEWRAAAGGSTNDWWWAPETFRVQESRRAIALQLLAVGTLAIALSLTVENVRALLDAMPRSLIGVALQGYAGLLVAGTIGKVALEWTRGIGTAAARRRRDIAFLVVLALAGALASTAARYYYAARFNNHGVEAKRQGRYAKAIALYGRSLRVDENDPLVHANLARALEVVGDYRNAEEAYLKAIALSDDVSYESIRLARLVLLQEQPPNKALRLLSAAQEELNRALEGPKPPTPRRQAELQYAIHKYRAWALLLMHSPRAKEEIDAARRLDRQAAAPDCLEVQWWLGMQAPANPRRAAAAAQVCLARATAGSGTDVEPAWLENARRVLSGKGKDG